MMPLIFNDSASENSNSHRIYQVDTILLINYKGNNFSGLSTIKTHDVNHHVVL